MSFTQGSLSLAVGAGKVVSWVYDVEARGHLPELGWKSGRVSGHQPSLASFSQAHTSWTVSGPQRRSRREDPRAPEEPSLQDSTGSGSLPPTGTGQPKGRGLGLSMRVTAELTTEFLTAEQTEHQSRKLTARARVLGWADLMTL